MLRSPMSGGGLAKFTYVWGRIGYGHLCLGGDRLRSPMSGEGSAKVTYV